MPEFEVAPFIEEEVFADVVLLVRAEASVFTVLVGGRALDEFGIEEVVFSGMIEIVHRGFLGVEEVGAEEVVSILPADGAEAFIPEADSRDIFGAVTDDVIAMTGGDERVLAVGVEEFSKGVWEPEGVVLSGDDDAGVGVV